MLLARLINRQDEVFRGFGRRCPQRFHCQCGQLHIAGTLKQKVCVALSASAAPPPKCDLTSRVSLEVLAADSVGR